jgi:hypothetical protein
MLQTKQDFIDCLKGIIDPLKKYYTPGKAGIKAIKYEFKKGINNVVTTVIYPKS